MGNKIELELSGFGWTIEKQLNKQGYTLGENITRYEKLNDARIMLFLHSYLTDSENNKLANKISKNIFKDIKPMLK